MSKSRPPYPAQFRRKIVALVRAGRTPDELSKQFEPSAQTISNWLAENDRDEGKRDEGKREDGVISAEREELGKLRRADHIPQWFTNQRAFWWTVMHHD